MIETDYAILGGGFAGLCAAMRLLELGARPLIIEAGNYPCHKICGEFFSPSSLSALRGWGIHPLPIHQVYLHTFSDTFNFIFPSPAGSLSHLTFDLHLAKQVSERGATLLTQTKVQELQPASSIQKCHLIHLSSGEQVQAKHLLIAIGRLPLSSVVPPQMRYMGFKAHFAGLNLNSTLQMFCFQNAYLGLSPVEEGRVNLACLAKLEAVRKAESSQHFMQGLIESHPLLKKLLYSSENLFEGWMEALVPEFGLKITPDWPRTYCIGDAASTIPPACGNGLSLALASGYLAAEFAMRDDALGFKYAWHQRCKRQIFFGKFLHYFFLNPRIGQFAFRLGRFYPFLANQAFTLTRDLGI